MSLLGVARSQQAKPRTVGIIGYTGHGNFGHAWDLAWNGVPGVQVVAVSDPDDAGRAKAQQRSKALRAYSDYRQMVARERPNIVSIACRWADERLAMFRAAIEVGAHIIVEKPFAPSLPDADEMMALATRRGIKVMTGHQARASKTILQVRGMIHNGEIGQIVELRARGKEDVRAGGEDLAVLGTHSLDLMRVFAGDPRWVFAHVTQRGRDITPQDGRQGAEHVGIIGGDQISATFLFDNAVHGHFDSRLAEPFPPGDRCGLTIVGTKGSIFINVGTSRSGESWVRRSPMPLGAQWEPLGPEGPDTVGDTDRASGAMARDFLDAINHDREPVCTGYDGRWTIEMIAGIYRSQFGGARVSFPLKDRRDPFAA
ncbi:MAG: Gfo/Idh/MocA family protein [Bryobacteraceae bacterium]